MAKAKPSSDGSKKVVTAPMKSQLPVKAAKPVTETTEPIGGPDGAIKNNSQSNVSQDMLVTLGSNIPQHELGEAVYEAAKLPGMCRYKQLDRRDQERYISAGLAAIALATGPFLPIAEPPIVNPIPPGSVELPPQPANPIVPGTPPELIEQPIANPPEAAQLPTHPSPPVLTPHGTGPNAEPGKPSEPPAKPSEKLTDKGPDEHPKKESKK